MSKDKCVWSLLPYYRICLCNFRPPEPCSLASHSYTYHGLFCSFGQSPVYLKAHLGTSCHGVYQKRRVKPVTQKICFDSYFVYVQFWKGPMNKLNAFKKCALLPCIDILMKADVKMVSLSFFDGQLFTTVPCTLPPFRKLISASVLKPLIIAVSTPEPAILRASSSFAANPPVASPALFRCMEEISFLVIILSTLPSSLIIPGLSMRKAILFACMALQKIWLR